MDQPEDRMEDHAPAYGAPQVQTTPQEEEPARLGPAARFTGTLFSPGETFEDINRKPTWLVPIIIGVVLAIAGNFIFTWRVNPDWDRIFRNQIRQQVDRSGGQMPSEEKIQQQINIGKTFAKFTPLIVAAGLPIFYLFLAGIFALGLMLMQVQTTFKKILSVVTWSNVAVGLVALIVTTASLMLMDREKLDQIDPTKGAGFAPTNPGALMPSDTSPVLLSLASSIDVFTIWLLILLSIGFAAIAGTRKVKTGKTATLVFGLWFIWVLIKAGWAAAFG